MIDERRGELAFSQKENSVCYHFLHWTELLTAELQTMEEVWNLSKDKVKTELDGKRNRVQSFMKAEHMGEFKSGY